MTDTSASAHPEPSVELRQFSAAALEEWARIVEQVLRAVAHALNNRAAAIAALIDLSHDATSEDVAASQSILRSELERVGELTQVVRALTPARGDAGAVGDVAAFAPADLVSDINAILRLYDEQRSAGIEVTATGAPPVRLSRTELLRACVCVAVAAAGSQPRELTAIQMTGTADGDWLDVRATAPASVRSTYAAEAAARMGGEISEGQLGFRVPSLSALRQRAAR